MLLTAIQGIRDTSNCSANRSAYFLCIIYYFFPLPDLIGMNPIFRRKLANRLLAFYSIQWHKGFEFLGEGVSPFQFVPPFWSGAHLNMLSRFWGPV